MKFSSSFMLIMSQGTAKKQLITFWRDLDLTKIKANSSAHNLVLFDFLFIFMFFVFF